MIQLPAALEIKCRRCRGTGKGFPLAVHGMHAPDCPQCAGTGLRNADDASSAQPHRFRTTD